MLFMDRGCPFAHRVLALLEHLGVGYDSHEAPLGALPEGLSRWSPSGRIPLLIHGGVTIGESRVMLEHLAEAYGFDSAYSDVLNERTLERHAMALMDGSVAPWLTRDDAEPEPTRLAECLDVFEGVTHSPPGPGLLSFHFAPVWLRFQWWWPDGLITRAIRDRRTLAAWLDQAAQLPAVVRSAPSQAENVADFRAACAMRSPVTP
ncbi:MAG: glutathione S-transferase N-terminal domain-containing protein [Myxococcales bacterium]|nr:glutathione S-transferase N-terminal domain-containing protein [Myxococcales bacterium]